MTRPELTHLAIEIREVLRTSSPNVSIRSDSMSRILFVTGFSGGDSPVPEEQIEAAIAELIAAGDAERVWRRGRASYRACMSKTH